MANEKPNPLLCFVCNKKFQQPKILDCLHNYCQKCLEKIMYQSKSNRLSQSEGHGIRCPLCRTTTALSGGGVDGVKLNTFLVRMVEEATVSEVLRSKAAKVPCGLCDCEQAASRCGECAVFLCLACQKIHGRLPASSGHQTYSLEECRAGKRLGTAGGASASLTLGRAQEIECRQHRGEKCRFYCRTCQELICRDCTVLHHTPDSHVHISLEDAASHARHSAKDMLARLDRKMPEFQSSLDILGKMGPLLQNRNDKARAQIRAMADEIRRSVAAQEKRLLLEIRRESQQQARELKDAVKEAAETLTLALHSEEMAKVFLAKSNDSEFLWLNTTLMNALQGLLGSKSPRGPQVLEFDEGDADVDMGQLESKEIDMNTIYEELAQLKTAKKAERNQSKPYGSRTGSRQQATGKDASDKENKALSKVEEIGEDKEELGRTMSNSEYDSSDGSGDDDSEDGSPSSASFDSKGENKPTKPPTVPGEDTHDGKASSEPPSTKTPATKSTTQPQAGKTQDPVPVSTRVLRSASRANTANQEQALQQQAKSGSSSARSKDSVTSSQTPSAVSHSREVASSTAASGRGMRCPDGKNLTTSPSASINTFQQQRSPQTIQSRLIKQQGDIVKQELTSRTTQPNRDVAHGAGIGQQAVQSQRGIPLVASNSSNRSTPPLATITSQSNVQNVGTGHLVSITEAADSGSNTVNKSDTDSDDSDL